MRLYDFPGSGNCYKIRLLLTQLAHDFERVEIDLVGGETHSARFRRRNPLGQTPFIEFPDGRVLAESGAILFHLAEGSRYLPGDSWRCAQVLQWMSFEQYRIEPNIGTPRFWMKYLGQGETRHAEIAAKRKAGEVAFEVLEARLAHTSFLVGERYSIADIALYGYTHLAPEAGYDLAPFPAIRAWMDRVRAAPGHIPIEAAAGRLVPWPEEHVR